jgi:NADH-quinone oxidoreductase subunit A
MVNEPQQSLPVPGLGEEILPLALYTLVALLLVGGMLAAARWFGARRPSRNKEIPYESGIVPTGSAQFTYPVPFYLIAIFFIVFDVEAVFIFTWGVARTELGLPGLIHITFFIVVLLLGLAWLWMKGGLDWGPGGRSSGMKRRTAERSPAARNS